MSVSPRRILILLSCCIGDVVLATAALAALRRAFPDAHIAWAVGGWSAPVVAGHPQLDAVIDPGSDVLSVRRPGGVARLAHRLRAGRYDLLVSLTRSRLAALAAALSGIPVRAGLDSGGRGFGYTVRAHVDPDVPRHEAALYLDVLGALGIDTTDAYAHVPVTHADTDTVHRLLSERGVAPPYLVVNPAGGSNPGMTMTSKRYPVQRMAALTRRLAAHLGAAVVAIGAASDAPLLDALAAHPDTPPLTTFAGVLSFGQIGALAAGAALYVGSDTGLTHLAAAAGGRTVMIFGPSDPRRYAPYVAPDRALALWQPVALSARGVAAGAPPDFDWLRDGITPDDAYTQIVAHFRLG